MKLVIFGLTVSSSWGNGHATLWRGLCAALGRMGHEVVFFERDVPYYAQHRDLHELPHGQLVLYSSWEDVAGRARRDLHGADVAMVTSYCADGIMASRLVLESGVSQRLFYDMDTPVTLSALSAGKQLSYVGPEGLSEFDLVLSYTGGSALTALQERLGARKVATLYGHVDPDVHRPVPQKPEFRCDLSYLGTYAEDRERQVEQFLLAPARALPEHSFVIGGSMYPAGFPGEPNVRLIAHVPPQSHPAFYCGGRMTLNVTRRTMAEMGYCPSGRLFEAAACGTAILSDDWAGLDQFFEPGQEIWMCRDTSDVLAALQAPATELQRMAARARARVLEEHTSEHRARELVAMLESSSAPSRTARQRRSEQESERCGE